MTGPVGSEPEVVKDADDAPRSSTLRRTVRRLTGGDALPAWFSNGLYAALIWCMAAGVTALATLSKTVYSPIGCAIVATVATVAAWHFRPRARVGYTAAHGPAVAAVAVAIALLALAGSFHSEHILTDRDPAVYVNTGRSIARHHRVRPIIEKGPFDNRNVFATNLAGFTVADHQVFSSFLNFLPVLLALGWSAGGDTGLLLVPALLGALALLALYALGSTVVGPRWALLGPALLTLAPLQSWFARDAYAELPLQVLALGGLWLYIAARRRGGVVAGAIAGIVLGSTTFVRIDALAIMVAIPPALAVESLRASALDPIAARRRRFAIGSFAVALAATAYAGLWVSRHLTPGYVANLKDNLHNLELACGVGVVVAIGILLIHRVIPGIGHRLARSNIVAWGFGISTVSIAVYAYKFRPRTEPLSVVASPSMTAAARKVLDQYFFASSFRWFAWYLGTFTLALVVVGFIVLAIRAMRTDSTAFIVLAAAVPVTLLYIARPSVSPDHLWAMRRYLPIALPVMTIAVAAAGIWLTAMVGRRQPRLRAPAVALLLILILVPAAKAGRPLLRAQMQGGALDAVHEICRVAGPKGAIAVEPYGLLAEQLPQTIRSFCGIPAAGLKFNTYIPPHIYERFEAFGQTLYVASATPLERLNAITNATGVAHVVIPDTREPERVLGRPARAYAPRQVEVWLYRIGPH